MNIFVFLFRSEFDIRVTLTWDRGWQDTHLKGREFSWPKCNGVPRRLEQSTKLTKNCNNFYIKPPNDNYLFSILIIPSQLKNLANKPKFCANYYYFSNTAQHLRNHTKIPHTLRLLFNHFILFSYHAQKSNK
jgi:hypothetical protein